MGEVNPHYACSVGVKKDTVESPFKSAQCHTQAFGNKYTFILKFKLFNPFLVSGWNVVFQANLTSGRHEFE